MGGGAPLLPETGAALVVRRAVRNWLGAYAAPNTEVAVALSGGADSLALTAAAVAEAGAVHALVVDHRLQAGSGRIAEVAAEAALELGCASATVLPVEVTGPGGMEAAARAARYAALDGARAGQQVLLGHTMDDQAETVLLGLARGSGPRSVRGMAPHSPPWGRPLLAVRRADTVGLCADLGLRPHVDPHNSAPEFTRVRLRHEVLPLLEDVLGGGVAAALARTAAQLREDTAVLDDLAAELLSTARTAGTGPHPDLAVPPLGTAPAALRRRAIRSWLLEAGARPPGDTTLRAVDALIVRWRGQGAVAVGGGTPARRLVVEREHGRLTLRLRGRADGA
ncbi:tRNA lysidine(34) synthetase TilS [Nocardia sp. NPDC057227]|uniref:tRNA lysidine(34) synthetase TilS n=1 Tax=Nocardia sp. NPDC057227 TaxID=3346056 RepID=UPI003636BCC1